MLHVHTCVQTYIRSCWLWIQLASCSTTTNVTFLLSCRIVGTVVLAFLSLSSVRLNSFSFHSATLHVRGAGWYDAALVHCDIHKCHYHNCTLFQAAVQNGSSIVWLWYHMAWGGRVELQLCTCVQWYVCTVCMLWYAGAVYSVHTYVQATFCRIWILWMPPCTSIFAVLFTQALAFLKILWMTHVHKVLMPGGIRQHWALRYHWDNRWSLLTIKRCLH